MKNIFKSITIFAVMAIIVSTSVFANQHTGKQENPIQKPVQYTQIAYNTIKENASIEKWYQKNYQKKGIHFRQYGSDTYVLISAGERQIEGYRVVINDVRHISKGTIYIRAREIEPTSSGSIVTQTSTYPHILIKTDDPCIVRVEGRINLKNSL